MKSELTSTNLKKLQGRETLIENFPIEYLNATHASS